MSEEKINKEDGTDEVNHGKESGEGGNLNPRNLRDDFKEKAIEKGAVVAEQAAEKAATAYAGAVAGKLAKIVTGKLVRNKKSRKVIVFGISFQLFAPILLSLLLVITVVMSFLNSKDEFPPPSDNVIAEVPPEYLAAYTNAAANHDIPWTVIAAVGKSATNHGRVSPYDDINRDVNFVDSSTKQTVECVNGVCKKKQENLESIDGGVRSLYSCTAGRCGVFPAIGSKKSEARGPFLITPDALKDLSTDPVVADSIAQDVNLASEFMASEIARIKNEILFENPKEFENWESDTAIADKLWRNVIENASFADPEDEKAACSLEGKSVQEMIRSAVYCQSREYDLNLVYGVDTDSIVSYYSQSKSKAVLYKESLAVAYAYSNLGGKTCSNLATYAGVFPLTATQARALGVKNRCVPEDNIAAAVKILLSKESEVKTNIDSSERFAAMVGGWSEFSGALGSSSEVSAFKVDGPPNLSDVLPGCSESIDSWLNIVASAKEIFNVEEALKDESLSPAYTQEVCKSTYTNLFIWNNLAGAAAAGLLNLSEESEVESDSIPFYTKNLRLITDYYNNKIIESKSYKGWGVSSAIARLSRTGYGVQIPSSVWSTSSSSPYALRVVTQMVFYGGTVVNDSRYNPELSSDAATTGLLGLTLYMDYGLVPTIWEWPFQTTQYTACGSPANLDDYSRPVLVSLFENMCRVAESEGVDLRITSSTRSNAQQVRLYKEKGPTLAARPAVQKGDKWVGGSPHEMGIAVDIDTSYGGGVEWLHSIVGCYNQGAGNYLPLELPIDRMEYAKSIDAGEKTTIDLQGNSVGICPESWLPVKRLNLFGFAVLCLSPSSMARGDTLASAEVIRCNGKMPSGFTREQWHIQPGRSAGVTEGYSYTGIVDYGILNTINKYFPEEESAEALAIAKAISNLQGNYQEVNADGSSSWGVFGLSDSGEIQMLYAEIELGRKVTSNEIDNDAFRETAINWALEYENNIKAASLLWAKCDWNRWERVTQNDPLIAICSNKDSDKRLKKIKI